jgi:RNA polymerase sigma factor (sigma-70 family)
VTDDATITEFVHRDYARLVNAVALVTGDRPSAEDLVQEALARAWVQMDRGVEIDALTNWVATVALNLARNRWRRLAVERRAHRHVPEPMTASDANEDAVDVARALATLPRRQREVAVLRYLLGMSTRDAATVLAISEGTVKNSLSKERATLATLLTVADEEEQSDVERG